MSKAAIPTHVPPELVYDFDVYADSAAEGDVQRTHMGLHAKAPDIFFTPRNGGHWMATRFADVTTIMTTPETFSNREINFPPAPRFLRLRLPPQDMDAPQHMRHRLLLLKFLAPREVKPLEPRIRTLIGELIDAVIDKGGCEFVAAVAVPLPVQIFMTMMHWDLSRYRKLVRWANAILGSDSLWKAVPAFIAMTRYLKKLIRARRRAPGTDPISVLLAAEIDGAPLSDQRVLEMCNLLFLAGLDTVTNAMTFMTKHLAEHPDVQQRLRDDPAQIPAAIEEFLRRYAFVNTARRVRNNIDLAGAPIRRGDLMLVSLSAASNDDQKLASPEILDLDRGKAAPHLAFNTGPHNCAGAPLARLELKVYLEEWLRRVPPFSIAPGFVPKTRGGPVMALETLPLRW